MGGWIYLGPVSVQTGEKKHRKCVAAWGPLGPLPASANVPWVASYILGMLVGHEANTESTDDYVRAR